MQCYKENNFCIYFNDISNSGLFFLVDWWIIINDLINGGVNYFSIDDVIFGWLFFWIEVFVFFNVLYVDNGGDVGFGIFILVVEMYFKDGDIFILCFEQDGLSGWVF